MIVLKRALLPGLIYLCLSHSNMIFAHNIVASAYADGSLIEGEIGFSNGDIALAGSVVDVFIGEQKVGSTTTDHQGLFNWQATVKANHRFYVNLGSGHIADFILPADELVGNLPLVGGAVTESTRSTIQNNEYNSNVVNDSELAQLVAKAVARQMKPLRKEIIALKEKTAFRDALGGIGYILGIFGIATWLASRKKR